MDLERRFEALRSFLIDHEELLQSEPLNRYPRELPSPYNEWNQSLEGMETEKLIDIECSLQTRELSGDLKEYFESLFSLSQIPAASFSKDHRPLNTAIARGMTEKKKHEVETIKSFLDKNWQGPPLSSFIDIGSGKGHLSMALLQDRKGSSVCVDVDRQVQEAGARKIASYCKELEGRIHFLNAGFSSKLSVPSPTKPLVLGLHCCGDLSVEAIDFSLKNKTDLLGFGCCYHNSQRINLSSLAQKNPISFSHHALTLATRSNRKLDPRDFHRRNKVKVYRYILHMILKDHLNEDFRSLGSAHYTDYDLPFEDYAIKQAPQCAGLSLRSLHDGYLTSPILRSYLLAEILRAPLGRLAELYILLDRALYLREMGAEVDVFCFFEAKASPRNIGIFSKNV